MIRADRVEVSWDTNKSQWLVRIEVGGEVIRRHCDLPGSTDEQALRQAAMQTLQDEGYESNGVAIEINKTKAA